MEIRKYTKQDEQQLFDLMEKEGEEWICCWKEVGKPSYLKALEKDTTYVVICDDKLCGFMRCIGSFTIYIDDLLVDKAYRGRDFGRHLMEAVCRDHPDKEVYVMSDVDEYYLTLGYVKAGTLFIVTAKGGDTYDTTNRFTKKR